MCMSVLNILFVSSVRGTVSKALLMSIVASSVLCAGLGVLRPSSVVCVREVRSVDVECKGLKPCCVGDIWCEVCENQPLKYFDRVTEEGDGSVGGWFCGCLVWFQDWDYFRYFPLIRDTIVNYGMVENGGEGPDGDRPQVLQVPVGNAIRACGSG